MANFFKAFKDAYKQKHIGDPIVEEFIKPRNTGTTVPNPKTLKNKKKPMGKFIKTSSEEEV